MALACSGTHDGCKPWGWRLLASADPLSRLLRWEAHFFERVVDEVAIEVYASPHSLCGTQQIGNAGEHWRPFMHVGVIPLCPKCCERLITSEPKEPR